MGLSKDDDEDDDDGGGGGGEAPSSSADRSTPLMLWAALPHMPGSGPKRGGEGGKVGEGRVLLWEEFLEQILYLLLYNIRAQYILTSSKQAVGEHQHHNKMKLYTTSRVLKLRL